MIIQLLDRNVSERNISRQLHISRNTIKFYKDRLLAGPYSFKQLLALDDGILSSMVYADSPSIQNEVERKADFRERLAYFLSELRDTGVTRQLLWEEYLAQYPDGYRYSQFCHHLNESGKSCKPVFISVIRLRLTEFENLDKHIPSLKELSNDISIPKYATHLIFMSNAAGDNEIENKIIYSIFQKRPKRRYLLVCTC